MHVVEARHHRASAQVDHFARGRRPGKNRIIVADCLDVPAAHRHRFGLRPGTVEGDDVAAVQDEIRCDVCHQHVRSGGVILDVPGEQSSRGDGEQPVVEEFERPRHGKADEQDVDPERLVGGRRNAAGDRSPDSISSLDLSARP